MAVVECHEVLCIVSMQRVTSQLIVVSWKGICPSQQRAQLKVDCRLNWQLHFGEAPKWSTTVKFILADVAPGQRDVGRAALSLTGDAGAIAAQLTEALPATHGFDANRYQAWRQQLADKAGSSVFCSVCCKSSTQVTLCVTASQ